MRRLHLAAIHLALAAMLLRALMPAGWMANADAAAGSPLVICTINGPVPAEPHKHKADAGGDICPFAAAAQLADTGKPPVLALPQSAPVFAAALAYRVYAVPAVRLGPQSPRAPPRFA
jgi:hypothetical protein